MEEKEEIARTELYSCRSSSPRRNRSRGTSGRIGTLPYFGYGGFVTQDHSPNRRIHLVPMKSQAILPEFHFTKTTLPNGLEVIVRRQDRLPLVAVNLWYHVGSKNEERRQRGFAHLFEHLMFEGSEHYPGDFFKPLQRLARASTGRPRRTGPITSKTSRPRTSSWPWRWSRIGWATCCPPSATPSSGSRRTSSRTSTGRTTRTAPTARSGG